MEITADNINVSSDDPAVSQRTPLGDFPCLSCRQITTGSPPGVLTENGGSPCGRLWVFFRQLHPKFPRVTERRLADELICVTSADHPAKFNCELKWPSHPIFRRWGPDGEHNSPLDHRAMDFSVLGRQL